MLGSTDRYLAAEPGFPGDGLNLNYAVIDFRNFNLKQPFEHVLMASGYYDFRTLGGATNAQDVDLCPLSFAIPLRGHLFFVGQNSLSPAQIQGYGPALLADFNDAGDDVLFMLQELLEQQLPLSFPEPLEDHLFGSLCSDAAGVVRQRFF